MSVKQHADRSEEIQGLVPAQTRTPVRPEGISDEEDQELMSRAEATVDELSQAHGG